MQFDRHGNRIWRDATALLDSEHARRAIGEVAVPYGTCSEPSNVQAGGNTCPYRFRCVGCGHFRTDVSYLPDLHAYLDDLLRNRERVLAAAEADQQPRAVPSREEITRIRQLITRIENGLDDRTRAGQPGSRDRPPPPHRHSRHAAAAPGTPGRAPGAHRMTSPGAEPARAVLRGRQADSARRRARVIQALSAASAAGHEISPSSVARAADVDRTFLYRHRDLLEQVHVIQSSAPALTGTGPAASNASLQADLLNAQQRAARLSARVHQLEHRLSSLLGADAWRESGLGAPADIDTLKQHNHALEQQIIDLRFQLGERDQDLAAARAANRELMAQINATARRR